MTLSNSRLELRRWLEDKEDTVQQSQLQPYIDKIRAAKYFWLDVSPEIHQQAFKQSDGACCAWHVFGSPKLKLSDGSVRYTPCHDFQQDIIARLEGLAPYNTKQHALAFCKSSNLGLSELITVRLLAWRCLINDNWSGTTVAILTSPALSLSINMLTRIKNLFPTVEFKEKESQVTLNNCKIFATASHLGLPALRSWDKMSCVVLEEFDHFSSRAEQEQAKGLSDRFFGKNADYFSIIISTPNRPDFMLHDMEQDPGIYQYIKLDYTIGLGKMFDDKAIEIAKRTDNFDMEYRCVYSGHIGNLLSADVIDNAIKEDYSLDPSSYQFYGPKSCGADHAGIKTACVVLCYHPPSKRIRVLFAKQWFRPNSKQVADEIWSIIQKYNVKHSWLDGANIPEVTDLMERYGDPCKPDYRRQIDFYKNVNKPYSTSHWIDNFHCRPVNFSEESRSMLSNVKMLVDNSLLQVHPSQKDLITALRTSVTKDRYDLDKSNSVNHDLMDALRLACKSFQFRRQTENV
jgi:hypothetical protein